MYLEERYPQRALLPSDPKRRAVNLQAASIVSSSIQPLHMLSVLVLVGDHGDKGGGAAETAVDFRGNHVDKSKTGGWLAAGLILGTELSERIVVIGILMNLVTYLVGDLHISSAKSANIVTNFMGTLSLLGLLGGFLADSKLGWYLAVAIFASVTALGLPIETCSMHVILCIRWFCVENGNADNHTVVFIHGFPSQPSDFQTSRVR